MKERVAKLIVKDANGNLIQLLPEIKTNDYVDKTSDVPISGKAIADWEEGFNGSVEDRLAGVCTFKGTKATLVLLQAVEDPSTGDAWKVEETGSVYVWTGTAWTAFSPVYVEYQGATASASGVAGLVPEATSAEKDRFLKGDGTWAEVLSGIQDIAINEKTVFIPKGIHMVDPVEWNTAKKYDAEDVWYIRGSIKFRDGEGNELSYTVSEPDGYSIEIQFSDAEPKLLTGVIPLCKGNCDFAHIITFNNVSIDDILDAGENGLLLQDAFGYYIDGGFYPYPDDTDAIVYMTDNGDGSYTLKFATCTSETALEPDFQIEKADGTKESLNLDLLYNHIGGNIQFRTIISGSEVEEVPLTEYFPLDNSNDNVEPPSEYPIYNIISSQNYIFLNASGETIVPSISNSDERSVEFGFDEIPESIIPIVYCIKNDPSSISNDNIDNIISVFALGVDVGNGPLSISIEDALAATNGIELNEYSFTDGTALEEENPIYLFVEKSSEDPYTLRISLGKQETERKTFLHLEKSSSNDIDLSPLLNRLIYVSDINSQFRINEYTPISISQKFNVSRCTFTNATMYSDNEIRVDRNLQNVENVIVSLDNFSGNDDFTRFTFTIPYAQLNENPVIETVFLGQKTVSLMDTTFLDKLYLQIESVADDNVLLRVVTNVSNAEIQLTKEYASKEPETVSIDIPIFGREYSYPNLTEGLVPRADYDNDASKFLKGDGTWASANAGFDLQIENGSSETTQSNHQYTSDDMGGLAAEHHDTFNFGRDISIDNNVILDDLEQNKSQVDSISLDISSLTITSNSEIYIHLSILPVSADDYWMVYDLSAKLSDLLAAGSDGLSMTEDASNAEPIMMPLASNESELRVSCVDNNDGTYTFTPFVRTTTTEVVEPSINLLIDNPDGTSATVPFPVYQGATDSDDGVIGFVPAAVSTERDKFLKGDGTWAEVSTAKEVGYSTTSPTDQSVASLDDESIIFYEEDSSNVAPEVLFVSTSGNQSISGVKTFADGINATSVVASGTVSASQFTGNGSGITGLNGSNISSGTVAVERLPVYQGATVSAAGVAGLVPSAAIADKDLYLKGDGTWAELVHPSAVTSTELSTGTDTSIKTVTAKVIHDYVAGEVASGVSGLVSSAPAALDTLNELAAALGNDPNFAATITGQIGSKLDASSANYVKGLSISGHTVTYTKGDNTTGTLTSPKEVEYSTTEPTASSVASLDNESVIFYETQNMAAGTQSTAAISISGNAGTADSVNHSLSISVDGGAFEGSTLYTFNGSAEKTVNLAGGVGITLTGVSGTVTINANPFRGATSVLNGAAGSVPAPMVAEKDNFLRGDGTWAELTLPSVYQGATSSANGIAGLVPSASSAEKDNFLRGDGTWAEVVQPAIVTSAELTTGTDTAVRTVSPKVIHDYVAGEVASGIAGLVNSAPAALDTLNELAAALGNDANFAATVTTNLGTKVSKTGDETIAGTKTFSSTISGSIDGNAATATRATQDASGNVITTTYATKGELPADYVGATANATGTHGLVPAATSAQRNRFLKGDGTWTEIVIPKEVMIFSTTPTQSAIDAMDENSFIFEEKESVDNATFAVQHLAFLKFNESATKDEDGILTWGSSGTNELSSSESKFGSSLHLAGSNGIYAENCTLGGKDFTIDFWVYVDNSTATFRRVFSFKIDNQEYNIEINSGKFRPHLGNANGVTLTETITDAWHHVEYVYVHNEEICEFYVDGVKKTTLTQRSIPRGTCTFAIGGAISSGTSLTSYMTGYIDNFQIVDGLAVHRENFTAPVNDGAIYIPSEVPAPNAASIDSTAKKGILYAKNQSGNLVKIIPQAYLADEIPSISIEQIDALFENEED